ncbi:MAG: MFS transporter [Tumebacillaceae bacterium]
MNVRDLHLNIKIRLIETFFTNVLSNMVLPFMTIYFAEHFGQKMAGVMFALNVLAGVASGVFGGLLADRVGRRRMMLIAEWMRFAALVMIAVANTSWFNSALVTFFMMLIVNISSGFSFPAGQAMIVDCSTPENRKLVYSLDYWSINASLLIGGAVGGLMFHSYMSELFTGGAVMSMISILLLQFAIKETHTIATDTKQPLAADMQGSYKNVFRDKTFMIFILACMLLLAVQNVAFQYSGVRLAQEMTSETLLSLPFLTVNVDGVQMYGFLRAENALAVVCLTLLLQRVFRKYRDQHVLNSGIVLTVLGFACIVWMNNPWLLLIAMLIGTIGDMMNVTIRQTYLADIVPSTQRGTYMAMHGLVQVGAQMAAAGGVFLGAWVPAWGMAVIVVLFGLISLVQFGVLEQRVQLRRAEQSESYEALG